jgi:hypothetical protein
MFTRNVAPSWQCQITSIRALNPKTFVEVSSQGTWIQVPSCKSDCSTKFIVRKDDAFDCAKRKKLEPSQNCNKFLQKNISGDVSMKGKCGLALKE